MCVATIGRDGKRRPCCIFGMRFSPLILICVLCSPRCALPQEPAQTQSVQTGRQLFSEGRYAQARDAFEMALGSDPTNAEARKGEVETSIKLALAARSGHDMDGALADLVRAQKLVPQDPSLLLDLGILEDEMELYRDADKALGAALNLQPGDLKTIYAVGRVKLDLQQLPLAEKYMREYLKARPEDASAHYGLGRILQMGQRSAEAGQEFERSIQLRPQQTESYYQLGVIELDSGRFGQALSYFNQVLAGNPTHGGALTGAGQAEYRQKQYDRATGYLKRAVAAAPDYQPAHYYYGLTLARLGQKEESGRELAIAAKLADEQNRKEAQHRQSSGAATPPQ